MLHSVAFYCFLAKTFGGSISYLFGGCSHFVVCYACAFNWKRESEQENLSNDFSKYFSSGILQGNISMTTEPH